MIKFNGSILLPDTIVCDFLTEKNGVSLSVLRLDQVHPVVSGNKLFKLHYYLNEAINSHHKTLLTFGGAFSNHLAATAYVCNHLGLKAIGVVRGNKNEMNSPTIDMCTQMGMQLEYADRKTYRELAESGNEDVSAFYSHACTVVPMGGFGIPGAEGAADIYDYTLKGGFTHICVPIGTGTTLAGLLYRNPPEQIIGFTALKGLNDIDQRMKLLGVTHYEPLKIISEFHFGGFAKSSPELIGFMNWFYDRFKIPLDFVYTAKMFYGIFALLQRGFFPERSRVLAIHTGGLQGNRSLPKGSLLF